MTEVNDALNEVRRRVLAACVRAKRDPASVKLVAISKTFAAGRLLEAVAAGQADFGENYLQEALPKIELTEKLAGRSLYWHFTGPVQSNKTGTLASAFAWVHGVDREKIARRLSDHRGEKVPPLNVCLQVNVSGEASKSGCAPQDALELCAGIAQLPRLRLRGLMCIPKAADDAESSRPAFASLRNLLQGIRGSGHVDGGIFDTLSMGMSADYEIAIEEGATMIRVGSAIFGGRPAKAEVGAA